MFTLARHVLAAYVGAVLLIKEFERRGLLRCDCPAQCWCHRPGLRLLRWTLPVGHGGRG